MYIVFSLNSGYSAYYNGESGVTHQKISFSDLSAVRISTSSKCLIRRVFTADAISFLRHTHVEVSLYFAAKSKLPVAVGPKYLAKNFKKNASCLTHFYFPLRVIKLRSDLIFVENCNVIFGKRK